MSTDMWQSVRQALLDNARRVSIERRNEIERWVPVKADDTEFIPGYIPYIGCDYFSPRTQGHRILAYALSQNFHKDATAAREWARDWQQGDGQLALDRQNMAFRASGIAEMHPFDTGHIPVLASLLRSVVSGCCPGSGDSVYPEMVATNLSKFSFRSADKRQTRDKRESLQGCWEWFSCLEVRLLEPDYIICCGNEVFRAVRKGLSTHWCSRAKRPAVIKVAFPALRVINRHYHRNRVSESDWPALQHEIERRLSSEDLGRQVSYKGQVQEDKTVRDIVARDVNYFHQMLKRMASEVSMGGA